MDASDAVDTLLKDATDINVVLGPVLWQPDGPAKRWYFVIASCGAEGFRCDQLLAGDNQQRAVAFRAEIFNALVARKPCVLHDCDDELNMARLCEILWPGERIRKVRQAVERGSLH